MKNRLFIIVAVVFFTALSGTGWAIKNPVGSGTVPPSSVRSGLVRSPNPINTSGNLLITGNVGGGKHFRGIVPYQSTSDFWGTTASSSLDSFLRRSVGSRDGVRFPGTYNPYYSPSRTVTTTRPGHSGVFRPPTTKFGGRATDEFALPKRQVLSSSEAALSFRDLRGPRPMSMSPQELEKVVSDEVGKYPQGGKPTAEQRQAQMEQFRRDLKKVSDKAAELKQSLMEKDDSLRLSPTKMASERVRQQLEMQTLKEQAGEEGLVPDKQLDVYEQMKQQLDKFQKDFESATGGRAARRIKEAADGEKEPLFAGSVPAISRKIQKKISPLDELSGILELSDAELSARAKAILGSHKTFASFSEDKFNQHLRAAEDYLKQGKYYRAADAYTLALIYKPSDPLAYAGKSLALFAAGEYMSSALFLSRALEIFPEYAQFKIDLVSMVGSRDKLESRIIDVEQWLERSEAAELQFLLGYIYYQMGRLERAEEAIEAAYEKMPESPAVVALKKAIDESVKSYQPVK